MSHSHVHTKSGRNQTCGDAIGMRLLHPQPLPAQPWATFPPWQPLESHTEYSELEGSSLPALPPPSPISQQPIEILHGASVFSARQEFNTL